MSTPHDSARAPLPAWAKPAGAALIVFALMLPRLLFAARFGLVGDEAYYAIWSLFPGLRYFDHPPAVAWVVWLGRAVFGESEWAVRSMFLAANLVVCAALYRIGWLLAADRRVGAVAAIAYSATVGVLISFTVATPDGPSTLFWVLTLWAIAEFLHRRNPGWWLLAGAFAGLGLLSKYTVVFLGLGVLLYVVAGRERRQWLKLWQVWAGGALALLLFSPVVWVDAGRGWSSFRFQLGRSNFAGGTLRPDEFLRFVVEEGIQLLPTLYVFVVLGVGLFVLRRARGLALPVLTSAPMAAYFLADALFGRVNPNWTAPLFPVLALVGAYAAVALRPRQRWRRWLLDLLYVLHVPLGLALMLFAYAAVDSRSLPGIGRVPAFDFVYGWDALWGKVSALAKANGAQWVDTPTYSLNGWLGYYARIADDPLPVYETREPFRSAYRPPMDAALAAAPHLVVDPIGGPPPGAIALGALSRDWAGEALASYRIYLVR